MKGSYKYFIIFLRKKRGFLCPSVFVTLIHFTVVTLNNFPCHLMLAFIYTLDRLQKLLHWKLLWKYFNFLSKFAFSVWFILCSMILMSRGVYWHWWLVDIWKGVLFSEVLGINSRREPRRVDCVYTFDLESCFFLLTTSYWKANDSWTLIYLIGV